MGSVPPGTNMMSNPIDKTADAIEIAAVIAPDPVLQRLRSLWIGFVVLVLVALLCHQISAAPPTNETSTVSDSASENSDGDNKDQAGQQERVATFAGGCFWCTEAVFERIEGVHDVISGYIGGSVPNPTYEQVCGKKTGHAEAVEIYYDPSKVAYEELLEIFFKTHDPTTLNKQGADEGPQYRSSVFYHDEDEKKATEKYIEKMNDSGEFSRKIVTTLEKATTFYPAEDYHQDFYQKNPNYGYCQAVVRDKVRKVNRSFGDKLKK